MRAADWCSATSHNTQLLQAVSRTGRRPQAAAAAATTAGIWPQSIPTAPEGVLLAVPQRVGASAPAAHVAVGIQDSLAAGEQRILQQQGG